MRGDRISAEQGREQSIHKKERARRGDAFVSFIELREKDRTPADTAATGVLVTN